LANIALDVMAICHDNGSMNARDIIESLGGGTAVAGCLDLPVSTVVYWGRRGRIPPWHWEAVLEMAKQRQVSAVNHEALLASVRGKTAQRGHGVISDTQDAA
jgi:hypothetical protein